MTLHEIEETLHTLESRHSGLNEDMLVTLLRSGGWEEKNIQEAVLLFRSKNTSPLPPQSTKASEILPLPQEERVFAPQVDENHLLSDHYTTEPTPAPEGPATAPVPAPEPQSLIVEQPRGVSHPKKEELPHNLPLRPFETSDHIWPFSRYRDVFFGETESEVRQPAKPDVAVREPTELPAEKITEKKIPVSVPATQPPPQVVVMETPSVTSPSPPAPEKELVPVPLTGEDERLVILAMIMLVAILLLLGYMYSNGRL